MHPGPSEMLPEKVLFYPDYRFFTLDRRENHIIYFLNAYGRSSRIELR